MRTRNLIVAAAIAAVAPVALAQVVIDDNFDDGNAASRYDFFTSEAGIAVGSPTDSSIDYNYDYSQFIYLDYRVDPNNPTLAIIPPAPGGSTSTGIRISVNDVDPGAAVSVALLPKTTTVSGDYKMEVYMWMNYNGGPGGGTGSTEYAMFGLNTAGTGVTGVSLSPQTTAAGYAFTATGEGGAAHDYRVHSTDASDDGPNFFKVNAAWTGAGRENNWNVVTGDLLGGTVNPSNHFHSYLALEVFPGGADGFETVGAPGKNWVKVDVEQRGRIVSYSLNGKIINTLFTDDVKSGKPSIGYYDAFSSVANPAADNFILFDNLKVTQLSAAGALSSSDDYAAILAGGTATANGDFALTGLSIDSADSAELVGTGAITFGGAHAAILSDKANHTITKSVVFGTDTAVWVGEGTTLTIANASYGVPVEGSLSTVDSSGNFTKVGRGTLEIDAVRGEGLHIVSGKVKLTGGVSVVEDLRTYYGAASANSSSLDFDLSLVAVDYVPRTNPGDPSLTNSPLVRLNDLYLLGLLSGGVEGIYSSAELSGSLSEFSTRIVEASDLGIVDGGTWAGVTIDASTVLLGYTFNSDTDLDQDVDFADLLTVARNFDDSYDPNGPDGPKQWYDGDSNGDGITGFADLLSLARSFGATALRDGTISMDATLNADFDSQWNLALSVVPEPATLGLLAFAGAGLLIRRR